MRRDRGDIIPLETNIYIHDENINVTGTGRDKNGKFKFLYCQSDRCSLGFNFRRLYNTRIGLVK